MAEGGEACNPGVGAEVRFAALAGGGRRGVFRPDEIHPAHQAERRRMAHVRRANALHFTADPDKLSPPMDGCVCG